MPGPSWISGHFLWLFACAACGALDHESTATSELAAGPPAQEQLELWLDASRGVGTFASGEVWWWEDQSAHGHVLGRGSPDLPSITVAKLPDTDQLALLFQPDASGDRGYLVNSALAIRQPMTIAMVFRPLPTGSDHWDTPLGGIRAPTVAITKRVEGLPIPNTVDLAATTGHGSSFEFLSVANAWTGVNHVVVARFDGDHSRVAIDGASRSGSLGLDPLDGIALSHGGDRTFHGYIAEVLIYGAALDRPTEAALVDYLAARYQ